MRRRFFADLLDPGQAVVRGEEAEHLRRVLRAAAGQQYDLVCGGALYRARVAGAAAGEVRFELLELLPPAAPEPALVVGTALFKFDRFEWMIEKATELGVSRIQPLTCRRTDARLGAAAPARARRWRAIASAAAQQARRLAPPEVSEPQRLAAFLAGPLAGRRLLLAESGGEPLRANGGAASDTVLLSGPEGGWCAEEQEAAQAAGFRPVSLGPRILRCETAVLAALALAGGCSEAP